MSKRIEVGDTIPNATLFKLGESGIDKLNTQDLFKGKKVVLFAVPGPFTPTCSKDHCPNYVLESNALKSKGVDIVACIAVSDVFVLDAWSKSQKAEGKIIFLGKTHYDDSRLIFKGDGNLEFTKAIGMEKDGSAIGLGIRSQSKRIFLY